MKEKLQEVNSKLQDIKTTDRIMHKASVLIQKTFRGFITRKKLENVSKNQAFIQVKQKTIKEKMVDLNEKNDHFLFKVGKMPE